MQDKLYSVLYKWQVYRERVHNIYSGNSDQLLFTAKGGKQTLKRIIFGGALELVSRFFQEHFHHIRMKFGVNFVSFPWRVRNLTSWNLSQISIVKLESDFYYLFYLALSALGNSN